jgi:branched-chain amino acid transport system substrate-binding protein
MTHALISSLRKKIILSIIISAFPQMIKAESSQCNITAGLFMPLSGPAATVGDDFRRAALMSHEKLPSDVRSRVKLVFEDTQLNASVAVNAYRSLTQRERPDIIVSSFAESTNAIGPIANRAGVPFIGCSPTRDFLRGHPFTFRHWTEPESMAPLLVDEMIRQGRRKVGLVFSEHPAMAEFARYFQTYGASRGLSFASVSSLLPSDTDFRATITQITSKHPDSVVYFLLPPQPSQFTKQFRAIDQKTPFFSFVNTESEGEVAAAAGAMEGVIYAGPTFSADFIEEFKDRHSGGYPEICSGNFYDIVQMIGQAASAGKCSGDGLRNFIAGLQKFSGVAGEYGVSPDREFKLNVELRTVKNGTFAKVLPRQD